MNYTSYEELHNLIKSILDDNYAIAVANIVYIEEGAWLASWGIDREKLCDLHDSI